MWIVWLMIGAAMGFSIAALCVASADADRRAERNEQQTDEGDHEAP